MALAITVENISKRFRINHLESNGRSSYRTLRESFSNIGKNLLRNIRSGAALGQVEDFWALRDVSFQVSEGDVVGIIGRNGAGKSTLLKILTRITEPTSGRAVMRGRVGSLLEVGSGFHPELTGRENVFLNGSILGMSRSEIKRKFDQIVAFSGVEKFMETPLKRYSSGMKVRLAFSVAAHLELEILLVDEVLAVGDAEFQRKCLGKMKDVSQSGRTVLFVSHNMTALQNLCPRALLVSAGKVTMDGPSDDVIHKYLAGFGTQESSRRLNGPNVERTGSGEARIESIEIVSEKGEHVPSIPMGQGLRVRIEILAAAAVQRATVALGVYDALGAAVCMFHGHDAANFTFDLKAGQRIRVECHVGRLNLVSDIYSINAGIWWPKENQPIDRVERAVSFEIARADVFGNGREVHGMWTTFFKSRWSVDC